LAGEKAMTVKQRTKRAANQQELLKPDFLERLPNEARRSIWQKISPNHISKMLDIEEHNQQRFLLVVCLSIFSLLLITLTIFLAPKNPDLYKDIVQILISFAGGSGLGYGLKGRSDKKD
jgi:hypothetical protein